MAMRIILDCNIWISFLIGHRTEMMGRILTDTRFSVYVCEQLINEIVDVAGRDKIRKLIGTEDLEKLLQIIAAFCEKAKVMAVAEAKVRDVKDLYLLSLAETVDADYIVSGGKDLLVLVSHKRTTMLSLADFKAIFYGLFPKE